MVPDRIAPEQVGMKGGLVLPYGASAVPLCLAKRRPRPAFAVGPRSQSVVLLDGWLCAQWGPQGAPHPKQRTIRCSGPIYSEFLQFRLDRTGQTGPTPSKIWTQFAKFPANGTGNEFETCREQRSRISVCEGNRADWEHFWR